MGRGKRWKAAGLAVLSAMAAMSALADPASPPPESSAVPEGAQSPPGGPGAAARPGAPAKRAADTRQPVDITAEHGELFNDERRVVYTGDVEAIQGDDRLRTPQLTVFFAKRDPHAPAVKKAPGTPGASDAGSNFGKIERMEAEGTVYFTTPTQNAKGDHGTYLAAPDTITLLGNVVLVQDKNVSTGDKLVIDRKTDHSTLYSNAGSQRVRGVFYQEPAPTPQGAPPAAKPAAKSTGPGRS